MYQDIVRHKAMEAGHGQIVDLLDAIGFDGDDAIPVDITICQPLQRRGLYCLRQRAFHVGGRQVTVTFRSDCHLSVGQSRALG